MKVDNKKIVSKLVSILNDFSLEFNRQVAESGKEFDEIVEKDKNVNSNKHFKLGKVFVMKLILEEFPEFITRGELNGGKNDKDSNNL